MISEIHFKISSFKDCSSNFSFEWKDNKKKVFVFRAIDSVNDVRNFYESNFKYIGTPFSLGEDAKKPRDSQSTGLIWFEVRNDENIPNAYRHSMNAQPLHTDGSYLPNYPSSTIMLCVSNNVEGGETVFLDSNKLFSILHSNEPGLLNDLMSVKILHERSGSKRMDRIIKKVNGEILVNWNYYCISKEITKSQKKLVEAFQDFLINSREISNNIKSIKLKAGDAVIWKDNYCLHGRNAFIADKTSDRFLWKCAIDVSH